jgi:transglutaminase-like putative cysteine protease
MTLQRRLQIHLAIATTLGTATLAEAQRQPHLAILTACVAATSVWLADAKGWLALNARWGAVVALAILGVTAWRWSGRDTDLLFVGVANCLAYLQCVLHYRRKDVSVYRLLIVLSALQTAAAAMLATTFVFGLLLLAYLIAAAWALCLLGVFRESQETAKPGALGWRRLPGSEQGVTRGLGRLVAGMVLVSLGLASIEFVIAPRPGQQAIDLPSEVRWNTGLTGFNQQVMLRSAGPIRENPEVVLRLQLYHYAAGQAGQRYVLGHEPWLRGAALGRYTLRGSWVREERFVPRPRALSEEPPRFPAALPGSRDRDAVLLSVTLGPIRGSDVLFSIEPAYRVPGQEARHLFVDRPTHQFFRGQAVRDKTFEYQLLTTGLRDGVQPAFLPDSERPERSILLQPYPPVGGPPPDRAAAIFDQRLRDRLQGLAVAARDALRRAGLSPRDQPHEAALALERFLRDEGGFSYTLTPPAADASRPAEAFDPVNEFVTRTKRGHCEYFASALALMLRSQGIPSRLIVGFKGGEWNEVGDFYEVRQSHAHTWVEAWIAPPGQPPGWLRLDPTPGGDADTSVAAASTSDQLINYLHHLWSRYVLGMDSGVQQDLLGPSMQALGSLAEPQIWRDASGRVAAFFGGDQGGREQLHWLAGVATGLALLAAWLLLRLARLVGRRLRALAADRSRRRVWASRVKFYRRLEQVLARCGLTRPHQQTPKEFATEAARRLTCQAATAPAAPLPPAIVEAYYRVRFGGETLSADEHEALEGQLAQLEAALGRGTGLS